MKDKENEDLKKIGEELWILFNEVKLNDTESLRKKIQELNLYLSFNTFSTNEQKETDGVKT